MATRGHGIVLGTWLLLCLCCAMCLLLSIVCPLPSCHLIIVSVSQPVSPSLPSFLICLPIYSPGVAVLCWSVVLRHVCVMSDCTAVLYLPANQFFPLRVFFVHFCFILLLKRPILPAFESSLSPPVSWHLLVLLCEREVLPSPHAHTPLSFSASALFSERWNSREQSQIIAIKQ